MARSRVNSLPDRMEKMETVDLNDENTQYPSDGHRPVKKRKAGTSPTETEHRNVGQGIGQTGYVISKVQSRITDLIAFCKQNANVHKEVKKTAAELGTMIERALVEFNKRVDAEANVHEENEALRRKTAALERRIRELEKTDSKASMNRLGTQIKTVSVGTQTTGGEEEWKAAVTRDQIEGVKNFKDLKAIMDRPWHPNLFKTAFLASGSPLKADRSADRAVLEEEGALVPCTAENRDLYKNYTTRYPMLSDMVGKVATMVVSTSMDDGTGKKSVSEKSIHRLEIDNTPEDWFETLRALREKKGERIRNKLVLYPPSYDNGGRDTRKMAECIFRDTDIRCIIYPGKASEEATKGGNRGNRSGRKQAEALIVRQEGKTYTDILRKVKENVKAGSKAASGIKTIRKIRDGSLIIVLDDNQKEAIQELRQQVGKDLIVRQSGEENRLATIHVKDIDGIATKDDVAEAIARETGANHDQFHISELRPFFGGNQATTVRLAKDLADRLTQKGRIRVGLSLCSIRERVEVLQCYKCWKYGHRNQDCNMTGDAGDACRNCGQTGHKAKECRNGDFCILCKTQGHRVASGRCPEHRKAFARARLNQKKRRAY